MIKKHKIIAFSIILGLSISVIDAVLDYLFFYETSFWNGLIFKAPPVEIYLRLIIFFCFLSAGIILSKIFTKHKKIEEELRKSKERYRAVVNTVLTGIGISDEDENLTFVNSSFAEMLGYGENQLLRMNLSQLAPPEEFSEYKKMTQLRKEGIHNVYESKLCRKDGNLIDVIISASPLINIDESFEGTLAEITDITDHKKIEKALEESNRRLQALFNSSQDAILLVDDNANYIEMNPAASNLLGYNSEELLKLKVSDFTPEPNKELTLRLWKEFIARGKHEGEITLLRKDGSTIDCEYHATASIIPNVHMVVTRDVSLRKRAEQELLKAEKLESLGILAGGIAHDFNNILMGILGNISLAKLDTNSGTELLKRLDDAENAVMRAKNLTQRLLTFSKGWAPVKTLVSIKDLLEESAMFVLRGSSVKCEFTIPDDLWFVKIDEGQINQVIHNLVINANQAMPNGGTIKVTAENSIVEGDQNPLMKNGKYVKVSIEDQGIGIPEENLNKIFDPYYTTKEKGSGLGLATTYSIIKNHGGYIIVQSKVSSGSTFSFYLPTAEGVMVSKKPEEIKQIVGKGKILVMDDEETIRSVLNVMLQRSGYEVSLARDGSEAIELYKNALKIGSPFEVIIMDLTIPGGMGGKETISKLREFDPTVKAIVSSGYSSDPIMSDFKDYGFLDVIVKPYRITELNRVLQRVMMGKKE